MLTDKFADLTDRDYKLLVVVKLYVVAHGDLRGLSSAGVTILISSGYGTVGNVPEARPKNLMGNKKKTLDNDIFHTIFIIWSSNCFREQLNSSQKAQAIPQANGRVDRL